MRSKVTTKKGITEFHVSFNIQNPINDANLKQKECKDEIIEFQVNQDIQNSINNANGKQRQNEKVNY